MGSEKTLGFELSAYWRLGRRFTISEKLDIIETRMNVLLDQASLKRSYRQWYSVTSANYNITPTTLIEANFSYYGPYLTAQSTIDQIYMAGLSFRQMFFNKKLTFTVTGRDVFGLYRKAEHIQVNEFNQNITTCNKFPIRFALTYKFNKFKRDERRVAKSPILE
jgi:hypothetical protein